MPTRGYAALWISLSLYLLNAPLGTYNTLAMFGFVPSRFVALQLSVTAVMIVFAMIAGRTLGKHCLANEQCKKSERWLWTVGFYIIGPPVMYVYYRTRFQVAR